MKKLWALVFMLAVVYLIIWAAGKTAAPKISPPAIGGVGNVNSAVNNAARNTANQAGQAAAQAGADAARQQVNQAKP